MTDEYWWWWVVHLWVEATWEVLVGCIMAWGLMKTLGVRRRIVTTWLYIEVALMFGSGILGLGHHYFWIGIRRRKSGAFGGNLLPAARSPRRGRQARRSTPGTCRVC